MPSGLTDAWASDNPRATLRIGALCEGGTFGAEILPDDLADSLDPPAARGSMIVRLEDDRVFVVAPDHSRREDPARFLGVYAPKAPSATPTDVD